ncbi:hypothetical protein I8752_04420 [Nostocaceae cyanobacterium CENA369]|uniref:Uncharacterized protein n=1 Tax=Dendronalium phyllosphericum CENA369 TaxID=1725256 RepID=A0A8J7I2A5_9NOST|nr:hypothetical protein [Dendronalium phyllosphericum]MBH8572288.1 hypothetical protein [Dendronalium phyllosphericum CENA369]
MAFLHKFTHKLLGNNSQNVSEINSSVVQPAKPKTLAELEQEIASVQVSNASHQNRRSKAKGGIGSKLIWMAILIGIPASVVWLGVVA